MCECVWAQAMPSCLCLPTHLPTLFNKEGHLPTYSAFPRLPHLPISQKWIVQANSHIYLPFACVLGICIWPSFLSILPIEPFSQTPVCLFVCLFTQHTFTPSYGSVHARTCTHTHTHLLCHEFLNVQYFAWMPGWTPASCKAMNFTQIENPHKHLISEMLGAGRNYLHSIRVSSWLPKLGKLDSRINYPSGLSMLR